MLLTDGTTALLNSWGFDSIDSLRSAITETVSNLEIATAEGHTEIVAEETEKLAEMQDLLCECLKASSNNHQRQSVSQIKVSQVEESTVPSLVRMQLQLRSAGKKHDVLL